MAAKIKYSDENMIDKRFGRLVVIGCVGKNKSREKLWQCVCDCGNITEATGNELYGNRRKSCGCINNTHHESKTRLYGIWAKMKNRCLSPQSPNYKNYGGRGITVCHEWKMSYEAFRDWAVNNGYREDLTIDRIDNNGNYEPSNCRWTTVLVQSNNRRDCRYITVGETTKTITQWEKDLGLSYGSIYHRLKKGYSEEEAALVPKGVPIKLWRQQHEQMKHWKPEVQDDE